MTEDVPGAGGVAVAEHRQPSPPPPPVVPEPRRGGIDRFVAENAQARCDVAGALAAPAGGIARHHAGGGTSFDTAEASASRGHMPDAALDLDGPAVVGAFRDAGAAAWGIGTSSAEFAELQDRGVDVTNMTNPEVRSEVINVAASTLSLGAMSAGVRLARSGAQITSSSARVVAGLQVAANTADAMAMGDGGLQLAREWDRLAHGGAPQHRLLGGHGAASLRGEINPAGLDLHADVARQTEAAAGLKGRLARVLGDRSPEVGSAACEAQAEIGEIQAEARQLAARAEGPGLSQAERDAIGPWQRGRAGRGVRGRAAVAAGHGRPPRGAG